jgi:hypothetical protein
MDFAFDDIRVRIRTGIHSIGIRMQHFRLNTNPDPDPIGIQIRIQSGSRVLCPKIWKNLQMKKGGG